MNTINSAHHLAEQWYNAADTQINTTARMNLYAATEKFLGTLKTHDLCMAIVQAFNEHTSHAKLIDWMWIHTGFNMKGAYECFRKIINAVAGSLSPGGTLEAIDSGFHKHLHDNLSKGEGPTSDVYGFISTNLSLHDRLALRATSKQALSPFAELEVKFNNANPLPFNDLTDLKKYSRLLGEEAKGVQVLDLRGLQKDIYLVFSLFPNVKRVILDNTSIIRSWLVNRRIQNVDCYFEEFEGKLRWGGPDSYSYFKKLGVEANKITFLDLGFFEPNFIKFALSKCPNVKGLISGYPATIDLIKEKPGIVSLECNFAIDPRTFPIEFLSKLTGAHLHPTSDSELEEMLAILRKSTKFKTLTLRSNTITKLPYAPYLQKVDLEDCTALVEIGDLPNLRYGNFKNCRSLKSVGSMPELREGDFENCLSLEQVGLMPKVRKVKFVMCHNLKSIGAIPKLLEGNFSHCSSLKSVGDSPKLRKVFFLNCSSLESLGYLIGLEEGEFINCTSLKNIEFLSKLKKIKVEGCTSLEKIGNLPELEDAYFFFCKSLESIGDCLKLKQCALRHCHNLLSVGDMPNLETFSIDFCPSLEHVGNMPYRFKLQIKTNGCSMM